MNIKMKSLLKEGMNPKDKIELSKIRGIYSSIQDSYIEGIKKMNAEKDPQTRTIHQRIFKNYKTNRTDACNCR